MAPAGILAHELGHFAVGLILGYPVRLNIGSVSGGPVLGVAPDWHVAMQASSGPVVTLVLMAISVAALRGRTVPAWAFALAVTAPMRFLVGATYLFWVVRTGIEGVAFQGRPNFDEHNAALALGLSPRLVVALQILVLAIFWIWTATRRVRPARLPAIASTLIGAVAGIALWMSWLGPALLGRA